MNSIERIQMAMSHKEPDRVPFFLLFTTTGAKVLGLSIKDYFSNPENIVKAQVMLREAYKHDCLYGFYYASLEFEAWGGTSIFKSDGAPVAGQPIIKKTDDFNRLKGPVIETNEILSRVLETIKGLKSASRSEVPVIGMVISPFSLPIMQMGFDHYLELLYEDRVRFQQLISLNKDFCIRWANAQLEAGADLIVYFDPMSSPMMVPEEIYKTTGYLIAKEVVGSIDGPVAMHFASSPSFKNLDDLIENGFTAVCLSDQSDLEEIKGTFGERLTLVGNFSGMKFCGSSQEEIEKTIKEIMRSAGKKGGLIITDSHGEIPYLMRDEQLKWVSEAIHKWGAYPLDWMA